MRVIEKISPSSVLKLHQLVTHIEGGCARQELLESAVESAFATFNGESLNDLWEAAAQIWCGLVKNHAFVDGNKRIAAAAANYFLAMNNIDISTTFSSDEVKQISIDISLGVINKENLSKTIRDRFTTPLR